MLHRRAPPPASALLLRPEAPKHRSPVLRSAFDEGGFILHSSFFVPLPHRQRRLSCLLSFPALGMGLHGFSEQFRPAKFLVPFTFIFGLLAIHPVILLSDAFRC